MRKFFEAQQKFQIGFTHQWLPGYFKNISKRNGYSWKKILFKTLKKISEIVTTFYVFFCRRLQCFKIENILLLNMQTPEAQACSLENQTVKYQKSGSNEPIYKPSEKHFDLCIFY